MTVFWFLCGNENIASSRIHGINIHKELIKWGYSSLIVQKPKMYTEKIIFSHSVLRLITLGMKEGDIVVFQKVFDSGAERFALHLKAKGIKIVFVDCDWPIKEKISKLADIIICASSSLCDAYLSIGVKAFKIDDAVELFMLPYFRNTKFLQIVWFGSSDKRKLNDIEWFRTKVLSKLKVDVNFITISNYLESDFQWQGFASFQIINQCDLVVIPVSQRDVVSSVKSANRLTQSLALGVPVLCGKIRAYDEVITNYENGLVSDIPEDWINFIECLSNNETLNKLKRIAFDTSKKYEISIILRNWVDLVGIKRSRISFFSILYVRIILGVRKFYRLAYS